MAEHLNLDLLQLDEKAGVKFSAEPELKIHNCKLIAVENTKVRTQEGQDQDALAFKFEIEGYGMQEMIIKTKKQLAYQMRVILSQLKVQSATISEFLTIVATKPTLKVEYQLQKIDTPDGKIDWKSFTFDCPQVTTPATPDKPARPSINK